MTSSQEEDASGKGGRMRTGENNTFNSQSSSKRTQLTSHQETEGELFGKRKSPHSTHHTITQGQRKSSRGQGVLSTKNQRTKNNEPNKQQQQNNSTQPAGEQENRRGQRIKSKENRENKTSDTNRLKRRRQEEEDSEEFGDKMKEKEDNVLRIGYQNINRLPIDARASKSRDLIKLIAEKQMDLFLMTEIGLNWRNVGEKDKWFERVRGKFRASRSVMAFNRTEKIKNRYNLEEPVSLRQTTRRIELSK
jgi:hypothetical protein